MANLSDKLTNKKLVEMETHIADIYRSASDDLQKKANAYFDTFAKRYEIEHDAYLAGAYTDNEFKMWYLSQVGRGERWQQLKTNMANEIGIANETAIKYINGQTPGIYALNANVAAYEIEKGTGIAFDLVNEDAVERLFKGDNHSEFRVLSRNPQRDYEWNRTKIQDSLLSGILQGESIDKIANRFLSVMGSNEKAAVRNARTAVTSAQNGGRQYTFNKAEDMGIEIEKEWIATQDSRTRDSHMHLDGVVVKNNEEFPNGLMYPGDPDGEPAEVYNCRCTMRAIIPKYNGTPRTDNTIETYEKWKQEKELIPLFTKYDMDDVVRPLTQAEASQMCEEMHEVASKYIDIPSKWKHKVNISNGNVSCKEWDCSITLANESCEHIALHENIHAMSVSYSSIPTYGANFEIEEGTVQLLAQEISIRENIRIVASEYDDWADGLRRIGDLLRYDSHMQFGNELIHQNLSDRMTWLRERIDSAIMQGEVTLIEASEIGNIMEMLGE